MADAPYYAPRPAPPSIRSAVPLASPCRPSFRNCHEQKSPPDYPRLWCLNRSKAAIALFPLIIFPSGGKVGKELALSTVESIIASSSSGNRELLVAHNLKGNVLGDLGRR